jgi:polar amino acid transport system substrate-binding protein
VQQQEPGLYRVLGEPIALQVTGLGVGKRNPELSQAIMSALDAMIADGTYLQILRKWGLEKGAVDKATLNGGA